MFNYLNKINIKHLLLLGAILRLFFLLKGADIYYGEDIYTKSDTYTYVRSAINLVDNGDFTFDYDNPHSSYARVPGYPIFWAIHYVFFGEKTGYVAVAITQSLLDIICIFLLFGIAKNLFRNTKVALLAAFIYAINPFSIVWTTISYSEILCNFLVILAFYIFTFQNKSWKHYLLLGAISAMAFFTREYAGILFPIFALGIFYGNKYAIKKSFKPVLLVSLAFLTFYLPWPIRNYVNHGELVFARSWKGFNYYQQDYLKLRSWVLCWTSDENEIVESIVYTDNPVTFPSYAFNNAQEKERVQQLVQKGRECGRSIRLWGRKDPIENDCTDEVANGFSTLIDNFKKENPFRYYMIVPFQSLYKSIFKSELKKRSSGGKHSIKAILASLLFKYRTLVVLICYLGLIMTILKHNNRLILPVGIFPIFIYLFICFFMRKLEMRNLLQADSILIVFGAYTMNWLTNKFTKA